MKRFFSPAIILLAFAFTAFSQDRQLLDERISEAVAKNLPEWKAENLSKNFKLAYTYSPDIEAVWSSGNMKARMSVRLMKSDDETENNFSSFFLRQVMPPTREIKDLGDKKAYLVETSNFVEIIFAKANIVVKLNIEFPDARKNKKTPAYYSHPPQEKIQAALKFAYVAANAIDGRRVFTFCENDFFLQPLPKPNTLEEKLYAAVSNADNETLKSLVSQNVNLQSKFAEGDTALHLAVKQGCMETLKTLISAKADVNAKNEKGVTPLMLAANLNRLEMLKYLISSGADIQAKDIDGRNAAFFVLDYGRTQRLVETNLNLNKEKKEILKFLQSAGLNLSEKETREGNTLLTFWMNRGGRETDFINFLLDSGIDVNAKNIDGRTALVIAAMSSGGNDAIRLLISRGANVNQRDTRNNKTALGHLLDERQRYLNDAYTLQRLDETIKIFKDAGAIE